MPFLERLKVFEMPLVGFLGFPFFALEVWSLYHLLAPRTHAGPLLASAAFAVAVLLGIDRWTVSSTVPRLADLPGVSTRAIAELRQAGLDDVFRIARLPSDELARRAGLDTNEARGAQRAAELVTLRGIGTQHAADLMAGGITTVAGLAAATPESIYRAARRGPRPTLAEVREWMRAARNSVSDLPVSAGAATAPGSPEPPTTGPSAPAPDRRKPSPP